RPLGVSVRFHIVREGEGTKGFPSIGWDASRRERRWHRHGDPCIETDGLHISYDSVRARKNRVYLRFQLPSGKAVKAVAETIWYERVSSADNLFAVGLKFLEISKESRAALKEWLDASSEVRPLPV
ncbi:MAG: hypothetical protein ACUVXD_14375, partial [Thermodesulfobacteriota bacterium]